MVSVTRIMETNPAQENYRLSRLDIKVLVLFLGIFFKAVPSLMKNHQMPNRNKVVTQLNFSNSSSQEPVRKSALLK